LTAAALLKDTISRLSAHHSRTHRQIETPKRQHNPRRVQRDIAIRQHPRLDPVPGTPVMNGLDSVSEQNQTVLDRGQFEVIRQLLADIGPTRRRRQTVASSTTGLLPESAAPPHRTITSGS
jgi:hypothetical protein